MTKAKNRIYGKGSAFSTASVKPSFFPAGYFLPLPISHLMHSSKIWASTALWLLLALPVVHSQTSDMLLTRPKWEFGLRSGAGFSSIQLDGRNPRTEYFVYGGSSRVLYGNSSPRSELYLGAYATRNFRRNWSVRSELSVVSKTYEGMSVSLGVFPRYRLTNWLKLETGMEHRIPLSGWGKSESRFTVGAVFGGKDLEFNLRFAPSYQPATPYGKNAWLGSFQAGASVRLASISKVFRDKK